MGQEIDKIPLMWYFLFMRLISENLVVITRETDSNRLEVLIGKKLRGPFAGHDIFPGGKAEGSKLQTEEAARELHEETGIALAPDSLRYAGKLLINDLRPSNRRFGNVFIYLASVKSDATALRSAELESRWADTADPTITDNMPPDVASWWPSVRDFDGNPTITHITYDETGALDIITKKPDFQNSHGEVMHFQTHTVN